MMDLSIGLGMNSPGQIMASVVLGGPAISASVSPYPTLSDPTKQALWIDFLNQSYTDEGVTLAVATNAIKTVKLPTGWGSALGDGYVRQNTLALRPTYRADGAQTDGATTKMSLPATVSLSGAFTVWAVIDWKGQTNPAIETLSGNQATYGGMIFEAFAGNIRCFDNSAGDMTVIGFNPAGLGLMRFRRKADNTTKIIRTGGAEASGTTTTYTWPLSAVLQRLDGVTTASTVRTLAVIVTTEDSVTAGNSAAVESAISTLYGVTL